MALLQGFKPLSGCSISLIKTGIQLALFVQMSADEQAQKEEWIRNKVEEAMILPAQNKPAQKSKVMTHGPPMSFDEAAFDQAFEDERLR